MRVLLTEGSSLTSREVVSSLGPAGYQLEVLDPDPLCLVRFSRWVRRVHRCPNARTDPAGYLRALELVVQQRQIDVVFPTHEQAWLLAKAQASLAPAVRVAVADPSAFASVQSKLAFAELLDELGLPQPGWRALTSAVDLEGLEYPYWLKRPFSTAGQGVREIVDAGSRDRELGALIEGSTPLMAQETATGQYAQAQGLFDRGRLVAVHTSAQEGVGVGGSAAARISVDHPLAREHIARLGAHLRWHGGLTLDYLHEDGAPLYLECNPRTVEPGNATASGTNIADLQVRLTLGEKLPGAARQGRAGVRSHGTIALLLGQASRGGSRRSLLRLLGQAGTGRGLWHESAEQLTPLVRDPPSLLPALFVASRLLWSPGRAVEFASRAVASYSIDPVTAELIQ